MYNVFPVIVIWQLILKEITNWYEFNTVIVKKKEILRQSYL